MTITPLYCMRLLLLLLLPSLLLSLALKSPLPYPAPARQAARSPLPPRGALRRAGPEFAAGSPAPTAAAATLVQAVVSRAPPELMQFR